MKKLFFLAILASALVPAQRALAQGSVYVPGDVLVMLAPGVAPATVIEGLMNMHGSPTGLRVVKQVSAPMRAWLFQFDESAVAQPVMLRELRRRPGVQMAQNNHIVKERVVPNDTQYGQQWHHQNIDSEAAWDISTGGVTATGDTIVVCIVENSDLPHPDLIGNAWFNHAEIPNNDIDDDGNGYVDDYRGWNTPNENDAVYGGGHGTQVAGMIGATGNNAVGVVGANWNVKMMVVDYGGVQEAAVVAAYTYPWIMRRLYNETNGAQGAFVVATNSSWGIDGGDPDDSPLWCAMYDSLGTVGVLSCGSTANNNVNVDVVGDLPTACASDYMISVTATNVDDDRTFSGYGLTTIDVGAPGQNVRTTSLNGNYGVASGTSFASPLTAGVIGLLYSAPCASLMELVHGDPAAGALYIRQALFDGIEQVGNLAGQTVTGGRISSGNSMAGIMNSCGTCPSPYNPTATTIDISSVELGWSSTAGTVFDLRYRAVGTPDWTDVMGLGTAHYGASGLIPCTMYEFQVRVDCGEEMSEYSTSFTWTSEGCCTAPSTLTAGFIGENLGNVLWTPVLAAASYDVRYSSQGSTDWSLINGVTNTFTEIADLASCSGYHVQVRSLCNGGQSDWSPSLVLQTIGCGDCIDLDYCTSGGGTASEWIAGVSIGTINSTSGDDDGYGDHTSMSTSLVIGQEHPITLTPGYTGFPYGEYFRVFMDLDRDGQFNATNEIVYDAGETVNGPITGAVVIPEDATVGTVRMRVVMQYNVAIVNGCAPAFDYGEVEDYCINLITSVGIEGMTDRASIQVFPDPADRDIFFNVSGPVATRTLQVIIIDASGKQVAVKTLENGRATVTTAWLADGLYIYRILDRTEEIGRGRFVVAHF